MNDNYNFCINVFLFEGLADPDARDRCLVSLFGTLPEPNFSTALFLLDHLIRYEFFFKLIFHFIGYRSYCLFKSLSE